MRESASRSLEVVFGVVFQGVVYSAVVRLAGESVSHQDRREPLPKGYHFPVHSCGCPSCVSRLTPEHASRPPYTASIDHYLADMNSRYWTLFLNATR